MQVVRLGHKHFYPLRPAQEVVNFTLSWTNRSFKSYISVKVSNLYLSSEFD